jgi:hypothetical protein
VWSLPPLTQAVRDIRPTDTLVMCAAIAAGAPDCVWRDCVSSCLAHSYEMPTDGDALEPMEVGAPQNSSQCSRAAGTTDEFLRRPAHRRL